MAKWNHRAFGTLQDPIHKSDLNSIAGEYGCLRAFEYGKREDLEQREERSTCSGKMVAGTATHETIYRAVTNITVCAAILSGSGAPTENVIAKVYDDEFAKATEGREVVWRAKDNPASIRLERIAMISGLFAWMHRHVAEVLGAERSYIARLGSYWTSGHIDLIYRPVEAPDTIAMCDWKTGAQIPAQVVLDHGFESGLYSSACHTGVFIDRCDLQWEGRPGHWIAHHPPTGVKYEASTRFDAERGCLEEALKAKAQEIIGDAAPDSDLAAERMAAAADYKGFPSRLFYVHLADYVPYQKAGSKAPTRPEQLAHYGVEVGDKVKYVAGDIRGPAWYAMQRTEHDVPRLEFLTRNLVSVVRMSRFFESIGEKCSRCTWAKQCLTRGYELRGEAANDAGRILAMLPRDAA